MTPLLCVLASKPHARIDTPWLYHKTTRREVYEAARASSPVTLPSCYAKRVGDGVPCCVACACVQCQVFDVLCWNERDEVTEFTIGNVVVEVPAASQGSSNPKPAATRLVTPPIRAGCLPGVMREQLLHEGIIEEAPVRVEDVLVPGRRVWLVNSVRGWVPVQVVSTAPR